MESLTTLPQWVEAALLGMVLAALGYVARHIAEWLGDVFAAHKKRRARLGQLLALLRAGDVAFKIQCENRNSLSDLIEKRDPGLRAGVVGYDDLLAQAHASMSDEERDLHTVVRAITIHTIRPLNEAMLAWLGEDVDFRVHPLVQVHGGRLQSTLPISKRIYCSGAQSTRRGCPTIRSTHSCT